MVKRHGNDEREPRADGRALRYQHRRPELLEAVLQHLLEHGLNGQSVRALADAVGISHVTLRHHFGSREQLLAEVFKTILSHAAIPSHFVGNDLVCVVREQWQRWSEPDGQRYFRLAFEVFGVAVSRPEEHKEFLVGMVSDYIDLIITRLIEMGYTRSRADSLATRILAQIRGLLMDLLATKDIKRVAAAFEEFALLLENELSRTLGRSRSPNVEISTEPSNE